MRCFNYGADLGETYLKLLDSSQQNCNNFVKYCLYVNCDDVKEKDEDKDCGSNQYYNKAK